MSPLTELTRLVLKNYNTPAAIAGVAPTLDYRFALDRSETEAVTLTDKLTFSRTATCAYTDAGGNLALAGANVPRFDHSLTTRQSLGLLVEEARTNLMTGFSYSNLVTFSSYAELAPDGTFTAVQITSTGDAFLRLNYNITAGTSYTVSIYVKAVNPASDIFRLQFSSAGSSGVMPGLIDTPINNSTWTRCVLTGTCTITGSIRIEFGGNQTFSAGESHLIWGWQLETGAFPTSYIPTTTATVTRSESATVSLASLPATRTLVEKPAGCATVAGDTLTLNPGYTAERVMIFPTALTGTQITAIRGAM